ncbi:MAG: aminoacyltransferase [Actinomycetia bacterium]|nr:aminoacyltransferase [Actinomycetes bacterium]
MSKSTESLTVRSITAAEHRAYVATRPDVPLEQTPGWAKGYVTVRNESIGWFAGDRLLAAGLCRYRGLPRLPMRSVAVFDSGPDIDWDGIRRPQYSLSDWLDPLVDFLRGRGVFSVRVNPAVRQRTWSGIDPSFRASTSALVPHVGTTPTPRASRTTERLRRAKWRPFQGAGHRVRAEVPLHQVRPQDRPQAARSDSTDLIPGGSIRLGTLDDLPEVQAAIRRAHPGLHLSSARDMETRWRGLASDDIAGVQLVVAERQGKIIYGGLVAGVGQHAWDLSDTLPLPDAELPEVAMVRRHMMLMTAGRMGADWLVIPTVIPQVRNAFPSPAPGWPPARLSELVGTWQFPVRATWHAALSPVVDRLLL